VDVVDGREGLVLINPDAESESAAVLPAGAEMIDHW